MIKKILSLFLLAVLVFSKPGNAQFIDSFTDGNFSANPAWSGNTADWICLLYTSDAADE